MRISLSIRNTKTLSTQFDDDTFNHEQFLKINKSLRTKVLETISGGTLVRYGQNYYLLNPSFERVSFFSFIETKKFRLLGRYVTQVGVWRHDTAPATGVAKHVFFKYLLPMFGTIISDTDQTMEGRRFWSDRIVDALRNKFYVYAYFVSANKLVSLKYESDYAKIVNRVYGDAKKYQLIRLVISNKAFDEAQDLE